MVPSRKSASRHALEETIDVIDQRYRPAGLGRHNWTAAAMSAPEPAMKYSD
ncbi:MAG: hypothetical protein ACKO1K_03165 [Burkholderiales bacterium]